MAKGDPWSFEYGWPASYDAERGPLFNRTIALHDFDPGPYRRLREGSPASEVRRQHSLAGGRYTVRQLLKMLRRKEPHREFRSRVMIVQNPASAAFGKRIKVIESRPKGVMTDDEIEEASMTGGSTYQGRR